MKKTVCLLVLLVAVMLSATEVSRQRAEELAIVKLGQLYPDYSLADCQSLEANGTAIAYVFTCNPTGYLVISAQEELPPLLAYSGTSSFGGEDEPILRDLVLADLSNRLLSEAEAIRNREAWQLVYEANRFTQWPPDGYSPTGGWLKTNWTQNAPYNWMCPLDPVTNIRSYAGCPAVAMGMIIDYHKALNGTRFTDADDYYHNYSGRTYWIDNDFAANGFPSFPQLNSYLDIVNTRFRYEQELSDSLKAAIVFAAGTAMKQVYSSQGSGTFAVSQALAGFERFNFPNVELLTDANPDLYTRISNNIKDAMPVHLAVVTPAWDSGHNVVVDGYNTNDYYHLNFGWGGQYNGWYLLPSQIPYGLTVIEGAVVDISPYQYAFTVPDTMVFVDGSWQTLEIINLHNDPIVLEHVTRHDHMQNGQWQIQTPQPLPVVIPENGMFTLSICFIILERYMVDTSFRLVFDSGFMDIPVSYDEAMPAEDEFIAAVPMNVSVYPNPFNDNCSFRVKSDNPAPVKLEIFNLKGQRVFVADNIAPQTETTLDWNGKNFKGTPCGNGIYLYKLTANKIINSGKLLKLK